MEHTWVSSTSRILLETGDATFKNHLTSGRIFGQDRLYRYLKAYPLENTLAGHDSLLIPPIHRLPVEIIGEIFLWFIHNPYDWSPFIHHRPHLSAGRNYQGNPITLSHVCGYWRSIVEAMPTLWQSLFVYAPRMQLVPFVEFWLRRAGNCLLNLQLWALKTDSEVEATAAILSLFVERAHYWSAVDFCISSGPDHALSTLQSGLTTNLKAASIKVWENWDHKIVNSIWHALHSSPVLSRVDWGMSYEGKGLPDHTPWGQLTHLRIPHQGTDSVLGAIQFCHNLQELEVYYLTDSNYQNSLPIVTLPRLHTFILLVTEDPSELFKHLVLPSLTSLEITYYCDLSPYISQSLFDLLHRSSCCLQRLELCGSVSHMPETELYVYLRSSYLQHLVELHLNAELTDAVVGLIHYHSGEDSSLLLPNLQTLSLNYCITSDGVLSAMVASRNPCLNHVKFVYGSSDHLFPLDHAILNGMKAMGVHVELELYG